MNRYIKCINNTNGITKNKYYKIISESELCYIISDDYTSSTRMYCGYNKSRFSQEIKRMKLL